MTPVYSPFEERGVHECGLLVNQKLISCFEIMFSTKRFDFQQRGRTIINDTGRSNSTDSRGSCLLGPTNHANMLLIFHTTPATGSLLSFVFLSEDRGFLKGNTARTPFSGTTAWPLTDSSPRIVWHVDNFLRAQHIYTGTMSECQYSLANL
jgi:hypothetical protein